MAVAGVTSASSGATVSEQVRHPLLPFPTLTTPARFRLAAIVLVAALAVLGILGVRTALQRGAAADAVAGEATPLLVDAEELSVALAGADAAASTAYLRAGDEPPDLRARYLADLDTAGARLIEIAAHPDLPAEARDATARIAREYPVYAGRIEAARTNSRLGHPVGAAYLREASDAMRTSILPAAASVYDTAARGLYDAYARGTASHDREILLLVGGAVLVLLVAVQVMVARRTRRILNLGLLGATVVVAALGAGALLAIDLQGRSLARSQRDGADQLIVLSTIRILALRSLSDDNLHLSERGTDQTYRDDFTEMRTSIGGVDGSGGLVGHAALLAHRTGRGPAVDDIRQRWLDYLAVHDRVLQLDDARFNRSAVELATTDEADAADRVDGALDAEMTASSQALGDHAATARSHVRWLGAGVVVAVGLAALLVAGGLWVRLREYR